MEIMRLQQDLFIMSTHTVLRHLEEERIWCIDQEVRDMFQPQKMWPTVLKADIPWRHWQQWLRERITAYCRENGKLNVVEVPQPQPVPQWIGAQPVMPQPVVPHPVYRPAHAPFHNNRRVKPNHVPQGPIVDQSVDPNGNCVLQ